MEEAISITSLNDFIFCPASIYFHMIDGDTERTLYQSEYQLNGTSAHRTIDNKEYSDKRNVLQGVSVYSEKYNLIGKIDVFDIDSCRLTERKKQIKTIYDGYIFQLYGQYFALREMGYIVNELRLYSLIDNKVYKINKPEDDKEMLNKFEKVIDNVNNFRFESFIQENKSKCLNCIYEPLCSFSIK